MILIKHAMLTGGPAVVPLGSTRDEEFRPRYPIQQPTRRADPREQAADTSGSRPDTSAAANVWGQATPQSVGDWQAGATSAAAKDPTPRAQEAASPAVRAPPGDAAEHPERLTQLAAVSRGHGGLEVSESDRMWHPHLAELLPSPSVGEGKSGVARAAGRAAAERSERAVPDPSAVPLGTFAPAAGDHLLCCSSDKLWAVYYLFIPQLLHILVLHRLHIWLLAMDHKIATGGYWAWWRCLDTCSL